jgi:hypothetical protein
MPSWLSRGEVVETFFSSVHSGLAYEKASLHGISSLSKEEMMSAIDASSKKKKKYAQNEAKIRFSID